MPPLATEQLKVWVHQETPEGRWEGVPARVTVDGGVGCREVALDPTSGEGKTATYGQQGSRASIDLPATTGSERR